MKKIKRILCAVLAAVTIVTCCAACEENEKEIDLANILLSQEQLKDVQTKIEKALTDDEFSGGAFVRLNKNILYEKYFGIANPQTEEKIDKDTHYQVSSITKNITGVAILQLIDEGKLSLDDTLDKFFDATGDREYLKDVTVGKVIDLEVSFGSYHANLLSVKKTMNEMKKLILNGGDLKTYITDKILDFGIDSGSNQAHSNYYLLGIILEKVTGESYADYIQKNVFDKADMTDSSFVNKDQPMLGYNVDTEKWRNENLNVYYNNYEFMFSSFGVVSTIGDMYKFYNAVMENKLNKSNLIKKINEFYSSYAYGFRHDGHNLYSYSGTSLHTSYAYLNDETKEFVILCSNHVGKIRLNATGKAVYNVVNSKINGMLLEGE